MGRGSQDKTLEVGGTAWGLAVGKECTSRGGASLSPVSVQEKKQEPRSLRS